jgi:GGDEF domain-containing protein
MIYPAVFSNPVTLSGPVFRSIFFGFCAMSVLFLIYLLDRHMLINKLRLRIVAKERAIRLIQNEASKEFLASLPALETFTDRLAMEFRRMSGANQPLSLLTVDVKIRPEACNATELDVVYADAGRAILRSIRGEDSMFLLDPGAFGVLLPRISAGTAELMRSRFEEELRDAAGLVPRFHFRVRLVNYPEHVMSAHEIMDSVQLLLSARPVRTLSWQEALPAVGG